MNDPNNLLSTITIKLIKILKYKNEFELKKKITKLGICVVTRKEAASFTRCFCFSNSSSEHACLIPSENTSGLKRISNSASFREPTERAAALTISRVLSAARVKNNNEINMHIFEILKSK